MIMLGLACFCSSDIQLWARANDSCKINTNKIINGSAADYLASDLQRVSHLNARRRLRSSTTSALVAPRAVHATIGDRTFPAAAASVWNSLPESVRASPSLQTEDRAFCPVVQLLWLRASHCTDYHLTSLLFLRVTCPCSLRTYATLKFIRSSPSSSNKSFKPWSRLSTVSG